MVKGILLLLFLGCGGNLVPTEDAATKDATNDKASPDPEPQPSDAGQTNFPDADYKPTCDDVGKFPGTASCCNASYCGGYCNQVKKDAGPSCVCAGIVGGCPWPFVCCHDTCVGVQLCK